jgi:hypothetical protein
MTWLLLAPVVVALLFVVAMPFLHGDDETDRYCSRTDRDIDERMRRQYGGWRNG